MKTPDIFKNLYKNKGNPVNTGQPEDKKDIVSPINKLREQSPERQNSVQNLGSLNNNYPSILKGRLNYPMQNKAGGLQETIKRPDIIENQSPLKKSGPKMAEKKGHKDSSILFGDKKELTRSELREKLRKDSSVWKAERAAGLLLSPVERIKLEKQVFSQVLGRNISKSDLKYSVKKLGRKMLGETDPIKKGQLRKEVKFFKKIAGK